MTEVKVKINFFTDLTEDKELFGAIALESNLKMIGIMQADIDSTNSIFITNSFIDAESILNDPKVVLEDEENIKDSAGGDIKESYSEVESILTKTAFKTKKGRELYSEAGTFLDRKGAKLHIVQEFKIQDLPDVATLVVNVSGKDRISGEFKDLAQSGSITKLIRNIEREIK